MAILSDYTAGTVSVSAGGTAVTGVGTAWQTAQFQEGDWFIAPGWSAIIASVNSNTSLTLHPSGIRGAALSGSSYRLRYMSDGSRSSAQARELIDTLGGSGNLQALGGLTGAADRIPDFTGAGTMATTAATAFARHFLGGSPGGFQMLRATNNGAGAVFFDTVGTVSRNGTGQSTGAILERGENANGHYVRLADGTQICWGIYTGIVLNNGNGTFANPYYSTNLSVSFPANFSDATTVRGVIIPANAVNWQDVPVGNRAFVAAPFSSVAGGFNSLRVYSCSSMSSPPTIDVEWIAIGRWSA